jgi:hypothetical protein
MQCRNVHIKEKSDSVNVVQERTVTCIRNRGQLREMQCRNVHLKEKSVSVNVVQERTVTYTLVSVTEDNSERCSAGTYTSKRSQTQWMYSAGTYSHLYQEPRTTQRDALLERTPREVNECSVVTYIQEMTAVRKVNVLCLTGIIMRLICWVHILMIAVKWSSDSQWNTYIWEQDGPHKVSNPI